MWYNYKNKGISVKNMAKRDTSGKLRGPISKRVQALNPVTKKWVKIDTSTGRIIDHKRTPGPYKGVRRK
jgi:hypothetical protein